MPEFIGLEQMELPPWNQPPKWSKYWGPDFIRDSGMLDEVFSKTLGQPLEERNKLLRIVKEGVIELRNRWRHLANSERDEAFALCSRYNEPGTGLFAKLSDEYDTCMVDLEARFPPIVEWIKVDEYHAAFVKYCPSKVMIGSAEEPTILFNNGRPIHPNHLELKTFEDVKDHLIKKSTLLEEQNQILARVLKENGIQIPREFTAIRSQVDALKESGPGEPQQAEESGQRTGERRDPCPSARNLTFLEGPTGSAFTVGYEAVEEPKRTTPPPPPVELGCEDLEELFESMHRFRSSKCFKTTITKEKSPKYFEMVREPRDLVIIRNRFATVPWYVAEKFFNDIRLMLDNYSHVFGEGSDEHKSAERFQVAMFKKLDEYGEAGQTAKDQFNRAPRATFNEPIASPKADETIPPSEEPDPNDDTVDPDEAETSFAQGIRENYEDESGEQRDDSYFGRNEDVLDFGDETGLQPKTPSTVGPAHKLGGRGDHADQSPSFRGPAEQPEGEDDLLNRAWGAFDMAKGYDQAHGHATQAPARHNTVRPHDDEDGHNSPTPGPSGTAGQADDNDSDVLSSIASPIPSPTAQPEAAAGESGDEAAHTGAHVFEQPAPIAPMYEEEDIVDFSPSPPRRTSHVDSASTKRARAPDDQDSSSDDDAPLIKRRKTTVEPSSDGDAALIKPQSKTADPVSSKRQKTAAESSHYAVTPSLGKRSRDDDDGYEEEEGEQPAKRSKVSSPQAPAPLAPVAAPAGDGGPDNTSLTIDDLFEPFQSPPRPVQQPLASVAAAPVGEPSLATIQNLLGRVRNAQVPPSPIPEPITPEVAAADGPGSVSPPPVLDRRETPEPANDAPDTQGHKSKQGSRSPRASADEPEPEPATEDLGYTNNGIITVSKLHRLPKYKRKGRSKASGRPNRPWVFGYWFGDEYGLYIMGCPNKGCEMGTEIFTTHPLMRNDSANHLQECGHDFTDDDDMVRKYGTQVISDDKKAVSIEWARKWNEELMKEYGDEDREEENF